MARHPRLQSNLAYGRATARAAAHTRGGTGAAAHAGRAATRDVAIAPAYRADPGDRDGAPRTAGATAKPWCPSDDPIAGAGSWPRHRDRRYARSGGLLAPFARPPGGGALRRANRRAGERRDWPRQATPVC